MQTSFTHKFWLSYTLFLCLLCQTSFAAPVVIGVYHYPPFMFENQHKGYFYELMKVIESLTNIEFQWQSYPYARLDYLFNQGKVHLEIGSSPKWNTHKITPGLFTDFFYAIQDVAVYREKQFDHTATIEKLKGQTIGVVRGYYYPVFEQAFADNLIKKIERSNENELLQLLINERINQVFINQQVFEYLRQQNPEYNQLTMGDVVGHYDVAIRVHPDHADLIPILNQAIKQLKIDGTIERLFKRNLQP